MKPIESYYRSGLLIDTNLLLLYIVGSVDSAYISLHGRTRGYSISDYDALRQFSDPFRQLVSLPHVLTETSNLLAKEKGPRREEFFRHFAAVIETLDELGVESRRAAAGDHFAVFGLTDLAVIEAVREKYLVVTDDSRLAQYMERSGVDVVDFRALQVH